MLTSGTTEKILLVSNFLSALMCRSFLKQSIEEYPALKKFLLGGENYNVFISSRGSQIFDHYDDEGHGKTGIMETISPSSPRVTMHVLTLFSTGASCVSKTLYCPLNIPTERILVENCVVWKASTRGPSSKTNLTKALSDDGRESQRQLNELLVNIATGQ